MDYPKLSVDLVPQKAWGINLRAIISQFEWSRLRWEFGAARGYPTSFGMQYCGHNINKQETLICEICEGGFDNLHLHEVWHFDDVRSVQRLLGFKTICEDCHDVIHYGRSSVVGLADKAFNHLKKVNEWSSEEARKHIDDAFEKWRKRSRLSYQLNIDWIYENRLIDSNKIHLAWLSRPRKVRDRLDALSWSQSVMLLPNAVILDTETTGLIEGPEKNPNAEVVELAIISVSGKVLYNGRFKPLYKIPSHVTAIHGIKNEALNKAPSFAKKYPEILNILHGKIIVAYNSRFDQKVIANTCRMHNLNSPEDVIWECAMWAYKGYQESPKFLRLPNGKHSALADCMATLDLINKMSRGESIS